MSKKFELSEIRKMLNPIFDHNLQMEMTGDEEVEFQSWTEGGVNMVRYFNASDLESFKRDLKKWGDTLDIDGEIELYRESKDYRDNFTLRESLEDFENFKEKLQEASKILERNL